MDAEVIDAYWRAVYRVKMGGRWHAFTFREGSRGEALAIPAASPWAIITAWNPMSVQQDEATNRAAQVRLLERLKALSLPGHAAEGRDAAGTWVEESVLVEGIERATVLSLLREFGQCAAVYAEGMRAGLLLAATGQWEVRELRRDG